MLRPDPSVLLLENKKNAILHKMDKLEDLILEDINICWAKSSLIFFKCFVFGFYDFPISG